MQDFVNSQEFKQKCEQLHLDSDVIVKHFDRIKNSVSLQQAPSLKVEDTCRLDNSGIVDISEWKGTSSVEPEGFVAFIPAAGVSSRYFEVLAKLKQAIEHRNIADIKAEVMALKEKHDESWHLPENLKKLLFLEPADFLRMSEKDILDLSSKALAETYLPKALLPFNDSWSFLEQKFLEHEKLPAIEAQVFVVGHGKTKMFESFVDKNKYSQTIFLEQSPILSTIRFDDQLDPVIEQDGSLSLVPAGHGVLTSLLWKTKQIFPDLHSAFIKNIDNTISMDTLSTNWHKRFLSYHESLVSDMNSIRDALMDNDLEQADFEAQKMYEKYCDGAFPDEHCQAFIDRVDPNVKHLWIFVCTFFHFDPDLIDNVFSDVPRSKMLAYLYSRPVNTMGQVPNTQNNVGGTPVFVRYKNCRVKVCLEAAHSSKEDLDTFFKNPNLATHFNPVFAACELNFVSSHYNRYDESFWILAKKLYKSKPVFYHESVLYELLGNSIMANVVFVEIPRFLFNPHKSVDSTQA